MLNDLDLPSLQQRREFNKLVFLFKIAEGMVPAINSCAYLTPQKPKRRIKAKQFSDYQCSNLVYKNVTNNSRRFVVYNFGTAKFRHSFFIDSVTSSGTTCQTASCMQRQSRALKQLSIHATRFARSLPECKYQYWSYSVKDTDTDRHIMKKEK